MDLKLFKKREGQEYVAKHLVAKVQPLIERFKAQCELKELLKGERERARSVRIGSDDSGWKSVGLAPFICPRCCSAMPTLAPAAAPPHHRLDLHAVAFRLVIFTAFRAGPLSSACPMGMVRSSSPMHLDPTRLPMPQTMRRRKLAACQLGCSPTIRRRIRRF